MKQLTAFVKKEFFHIIRDVRTLLVLVGMPVILITIFGFALSVEIGNINVGVLAPKYDGLVQELVRKIDASRYFTVTQRLTDPGQADGLLRTRQVDMVLSFENGFEERLGDPEGTRLSVQVDGSDPNMASTEVMYISSLVSSYMAGLTGGQGGQGMIVPSVKMLYNPMLKSSYNFVPGVLGLVLMLICSLMTSVSIVREKETGTMEVLLVSPVRHYTIVFAKMMPYFVLSCVVLAIIFVLSFTVLGVPLMGSLFWLTVISVLYVILSLSIGLLVSTLVSTQLAAALMTGMVFMLPVFMLSGMIFPLENMPGIFQVISNIVPAKWYICAVRKIMIEGLGVHHVWRELLILLGMTVVILGVALKKFKYRLE